MSEAIKAVLDIRWRLFPARRLDCDFAYAGPVYFFASVLLHELGQRRGYCATAYP